jgi:hypothetical protein
MDFVNSFGFANVDNAAMLKLKIISEVLVFNILNNVLHVVKALEVKTIKKGHFLGVLQILKDAANKCQGRKQAGGGTVLPSEYFGYDSARYFENVDFHNTAYLDDMTRGPLYVQEAGGASAAHFLSVCDLKEIIAKYKTEKNLDFKVSKDVYELIMSSVDSNLKQLLSACSVKVLTVKAIQKVIKSDKSMTYFEAVL